MALVGKQLPLLGAAIAVEPPEEEKQRRLVSVVPPAPPAPPAPPPPAPLLSPVAVYAPSASGKGRKGAPQLAAPEVALAAAMRTGTFTTGSARMRRHAPLLPPCSASSCQVKTSQPAVSEHNMAHTYGLETGASPWAT